jgi:hypothetical protein
VSARSFLWFLSALHGSGSGWGSRGSRLGVLVGTFVGMLSTRGVGVSPVQRGTLSNHPKWEHLGGYHNMSGGWTQHHHLVRQVSVRTS